MLLLLAVLLLGYVFHPVHNLSVEALLNGNVSHGCAWCGAMPMFFARREHTSTPANQNRVCWGPPVPRRRAGSVKSDRLRVAPSRSPKSRSTSAQADAVPCGSGT